MLTWLRRMIHSLTVLAMLTWLVVNGPGAVLETRGADVSPDGSIGQTFSQSGHADLAEENGPGVVFLLGHADLTRSDKDSRYICIG
jgi:hypothetical protein